MYSADSYRVSIVSGFGLGGGARARSRRRWRRRARWRPNRPANRAVALSTPSADCALRLVLAARTTGEVERGPNYHGSQEHENDQQHGGSSLVCVTAQAGSQPKYCLPVPGGMQAVATLGGASPVVESSDVAGDARGPSETVRSIPPWESRFRRSRSSDLLSALGRAEPDRREAGGSGDPGRCQHEASFWRCDGPRHRAVPDPDPAARLLAACRRTPPRRRPA